MKATFIGTGVTLTVLAFAGLSASAAFANTASSTATTTAVTATTTATTTKTTTSTSSSSSSSSSASSSSTSGSSTLSGLLATLQSLIARVHELQQQILGVKTQVGTLLNSNYTVGSSSPEIKQIQQLLASDPSIYPQGLATGYFGSLTAQAISRFQQKNGLPVTGQLDTATKALLQEYMNQASSTIPHGFLSNGRVRGEVEKSFAAHCHEMHYGDDQFCGQVQAHIGQGFGLGSSTASTTWGQFLQNRDQNREQNQEQNRVRATTSSSEDFKSWWAPFLNKFRGDHGNGNGDQNRNQGGDN